ncbi:MAG: hypothetical protein MSG64_19900 [Pyrinomonadaceae bacterium MAG19_C2-C3]|nr:hypothetical protein [Pyrinomonadaceae bacterium MAG19_C2-C3]
MATIIEETRAPGVWRVMEDGRACGGTNAQGAAKLSRMFGFALRPLPRSPERGSLGVDFTIEVLGEAYRQWANSLAKKGEKT